MVCAWEAKMRTCLFMLLIAVCVLGDQNEDRRKKLPYVADAVGNTLPPPSNVPATVGSPSNLLTPDRYEFYTFDESGELVKRLMTLEEIQAIVAAGEDSEGLVTFANDNQPTIAFNFSQPPYTKVHSVVTNVQNVLKAQMEAHKNKPPPNPTLDTPDVSDSWSLILPSIFSNSGVDFLPEISSSSFTTPETETIEAHHPQEANDNSLSKEGSNQILSTTTPSEDSKKVANKEMVPVTEEIKIIPISSSTARTTTTTSTTTTAPTTTTTRKPPTTSTSTTTTSTTTTAPTTTSTRKATTTSTTTTTSKPLTTTTTTNRPRLTSTTTIKPHTIITTAKPTTSKPIEKTTHKVTTTKPDLNTTLQPVASTHGAQINNFTKVTPSSSNGVVSTTEKNTVQFEKISTYVPFSTVAYVTSERTTEKTSETANATVVFISTTKRSVTTPRLSSTTSSPKIQPSVTTNKPSTNSTPIYVSSMPNDFELEKTNATTITTQSVSPSTTMSSTEYMPLENSQTLHNIIEKKPISGDVQNEPVVPLFDVAQSISQIATDLGNYQPIPTSSNLLDTAVNMSNISLESKENTDMDIPNNETEIKTTVTPINITDNFVQISTFDPHTQNENKPLKDKEVIKLTTSKATTTAKVTQKLELTTAMPIITTTDPILSESMADLLSQVVNQAPPQSVIEPEKILNDKMSLTTEKIQENKSNSEIVPVKEIIPNINKTSMEYLHKNQEMPDKKEPISNKTDGITPKPMDMDSNTNLNSTNITKESGTTFVQISILNNKNDSKPVSASPVNKVKTNVTKINFNETQSNPTEVNQRQPTPNQDQKIVSQTNIVTNEKQKLSSTTTKPTTPIKGPLFQSTGNKIISAENNKLPDKEIKDKLSDTLPKVDEFKKKIQKVNIDDKELANERNSSWKLISTVSPPKANEIPKDKFKTDGFYNPEINEDKHIVLDYSKENQGLEVTTKDLGEDIAQFTELCNELAFRYWNVMVENIDKKRSFVLSPYSITSMLAMMFMGARGATSGEMNEILKLDDMVTFNPHFTLKNISDSIVPSPDTGVVVSAFVRELYSDRNKGRILDFYKERAQHFYSGHVEEINFKLISDIIRRRTNLLVKRHSWGRIMEYMKSNTITMQPPLAAFSANIFQTDCTGSSVEGRDGEMYFVVSPNVRQRRLVPVPAVVYKKGFLAGYDPVLDATAAALGHTNSIISTLFLMPGQQGNIVHAEDLEALEKRLLDSNPTTPAWNRLLRTLLPRMGLELQIPRFSHNSLFNVSTTLRKMGLKDLFDPEHADLGGLNGPSKNLYLSDMIQSTTFVTCAEGIIGEQHHIEEYPETMELTRRRRTSRWATSWDEPRDYQRAFHDPHDVGDAMNLPLHLRPRQARLPARNVQPARLKFDRPFLYFVRHNPTGMILYVGRYNPRLLP